MELACLIAVMIILRYGAGERFGAYVVKKRGKVWTVHHTPSFLFFYANLEIFLRLRERAFRKLAAELSDDVLICEESIWLDASRDGAGRIETRQASFLDHILGWQIFWVNLYNWNPFRRKKRSLRNEIWSAYWTATEFRTRFLPQQRPRLLGDNGVAGSLLYSILFIYPVGIVLTLFAVQITNNNSMYDMLYTAADAGTLAGAQQQVTQVIESQNGFPSLWTQTINDESAVLQTDRLFRENLQGSFPSSFIDQHMYFGNNQSPGFTEADLNPFLTFTIYNYQGQVFQNGVKIDLPVAIDTNLIDSAMAVIEGQNWSNQIHMIVRTRSSFSFLLYDAAHTSGYKP